MTAHRAAACLAALAFLSATGAAGAELSGSDSSGGPAALAFAVRIVIPNQDPVVLGTAESPQDSPVPAAPLAYPADGSVVAVEAATESATVLPAGSIASVDLTKVSLFGGEITADSIAARAQASSGDSGPTGAFDGAALTNLVVLGQPTQAGQNALVQLADWGHALVLEQLATDATGATTQTHDGIFIGLDIVLDADHGGLPAGTRILVGYGEAASSAPVAAEPPPTTTGTVEPSSAPSPTLPSPAPTTTTQQTAHAPAPQPAPKQKKLRKAPTLKPPEPDRLPSGAPSPFVLAPPNLRPELTAGGYVFPVFGLSAYSDTFGAPRADVTYHHGDDIFASLGAPLLAVATGTVFSVGWNDIGGNRLWLRDGEGNEFYYAHLSAFSTLAVDGAHVHAGDVLGFVGNTGDAAGTPYHLHFEVHPVELLFLGYDGAVDPTTYLDAWKHLQDVRLRPSVGGSPPVTFTSHAPTPGAILLQSTDISTASGLDPGSLQRALSPGPRAGEGALVLPVDLTRG